MNPLIYVFGAAVIFSYATTAYALLKLEFSVVGFDFLKIEETKIYFQLKLKFENKTSFKIKFQSMVFDMILNNSKIGVIEKNINTIIFANQYETVNVDFYIDKELVGNDFFKKLITSDFLNLNFKLQGFVKADYKSFPHEASWTIDDFLK